VSRKSKIRTPAQVPEYLRANSVVPVKTTYIRFLAPVNADTVAKLLQTVDQGLKDGSKRLHILISSPGGSVFHGLSAYNFLKGLPVEIVTHNFGSVDSIGVVLFSAGSLRLCVPHARFLIHGVQSQFPQGAALEEPQLEERLKSMRIDIKNIARVIATTTSRSEGEITQMMLDRTALSPEQSVDFGLVHEIRENLIPSDAGIHSIEEAIGQPQGAQSLPPQMRAIITQPSVKAPSLN
jgi:ATP-dependent Clp protease, protease subunit